MIYFLTIGNAVLYTIVDNVRSLYNVGAIFRTADGAGVSKLFLTGITGQPPHREIRKVALGAEEEVPWEYFKNGIDLIESLKQERIRIVVLEATPDSVSYDSISYDFPMCLVIGHEYHGVTPDILARADQIIQIPMRGSKVSLNVAVAFGIAVYEITKYRSV